MIDCPNAEMRERLPDFVHGQLGPAARAEVAAHAASCATCAAELALLRELREMLRTAPSVDVARIVRALPAAPARIAGIVQVPHRRTWRHLDWRVAAGIVALAAAVGSAVVLGPRGDGGGGGRLVQTRTTGRGAGPAELPIQRVAASLSLDADLADATPTELEQLLADLESFDGLPAGEPEPTLPTPGDAEVDR